MSASVQSRGLSSRGTKVFPYGDYLPNNTKSFVFRFFSGTFHFFFPIGCFPRVWGVNVLVFGNTIPIYQVKILKGVNVRTTFVPGFHATRGLNKGNKAPTYGRIEPRRRSYLHIGVFRAFVEGHFVTYLVLFASVLPIESTRSHGSAVPCPGDRRYFCKILPSYHRSL